jgi:hypothetical protein
MLETEVASMASAVQTRTMRDCYIILNLQRVYKMRDAVVKVVPVVPVNFFACPDWAVL